MHFRVTLFDQAPTRILSPAMNCAKSRSTITSWDLGDRNYFLTETALLVLRELYYIARDIFWNEYVTVRQTSSRKVFHITPLISHRSIE